MASIGRIEEYEESVEDWPTYIERLEEYMTANGIEEKKKVSTLISVMGAKMYGLLKSLVAPDKPNTKSFEDICAILSSHLSPKPLVIVERFRFYKRDQLQGESVANYIATLRKLSTTCEFGTFLDDALRDRLVCGVTCEAAQKRLLTESKLDFERACRIVTSMEIAIQDTKLLQGANIHRMQAQQSSAQVIQAKRNSPSNEEYACMRCGGNNHASKKCKFINILCNYCHKRGHIERVCLSKRRDVKAVEEEIPNTDTEVPVNNIMINRTAIDPIWVTPIVKNIPLRMELDTGAAVSLLPYSLYTKYFSNETLRPCKSTLRTYSGEKIVTHGTIQVPVEYEQQKRVLDLYVVGTAGPPLFGRSWLNLLQLNWKSIKSVSSTSNRDMSKCVNEILKKFNDVTQDGVGTLKDIKAHLTVKENNDPKFYKARTVPYAIKCKVEKDIDRLEAEGIISKVENSEWASPIVPVAKANGEIRICGDFKITINPVLDQEHYPIPRIEDIFANLAGGTLFTKIDLAQAYNQIEVDDESKPFLTINTHKGLYRYQRLPFGIATAPSIFQRAIEQVLQRIPGVQVYFDDILITGKDDDEHLRTLETVLERLQKYGLRIRKDKCKFLQKSVEYLGHIIDKDGLHKAKPKVDAILNAPEPSNVGQLRSFLGMLQYYNKFIPNLATVVQPLNQLLRQNQKWVWTKTAAEAFRSAKKLLSVAPVLTYYDVNKPVSLACDASPYGVGAVISHIMPNGDEKPIGYGSRSLTQAERNYSQIDREALGIIYGVQKFFPYLYGREFTLITDNKPLFSILHPEKGIPPLAASRLQRWALFLSGFNYKIECRSSIENSNADGLSRLPLECNPATPNTTEEVFTINYMSDLPLSTPVIAQHTRRDKLLSIVYERTLNGWSKCDDEALAPYYRRRTEIAIYDGCIMWGMRVLIPESLRKSVLDELHSGHLGMVKMKQVARSYVWWPGLDECIENIARSCTGCAKTLAMPDKASVYPWQYPEKPWQRIHIDFCQYESHQILVVVDAFSKWAEAIVMSSTTSQQTIRVLRELFSKYGVVHQLHSDNGPQFTSDEFKMFLKSNGIRQTLSAPYHPATNGLAERFVQTIKNGLKAMKGTDIHKKVAQFMLAYRRAPHATTGSSPAELFLGRQVRTILDIMKPDRREVVLQKQQRMCDIGKKVRHFEIGETVLARCYGKQMNNQWRRGIVLSKHGSRTYSVQLPDGMIWKRHLNQIRSTDVPEEPVKECITNTLQPYPPLDTGVQPSTTPIDTPPQLDTETTVASPPQITPHQTPSQVHVPEPINSPAPTVNTEIVTSDLRRSTRERRAPVRLGIDE